VVCYEQALASLTQLPTTPQTQADSIEIRFNLRNALLPLGEHQGILDHLYAAERLSETLGHDHQLGQILCYRSIHFSFLGNDDDAIVTAKRALALATASRDFDVQVVAQHYLGVVYHQIADYRQSMTYARQVIDALSGTLVYERFGQFLQPALGARMMLTVFHAEAGNFSSALATGTELLRFAEEIAHPYGLIAASLTLGELYYRQGDLRQALPLLERSYQLCQDANVALLLPRLVPYLGASYALVGRIAEAQPHVDHLLEYLAAGNQDVLGHILTRLGEALLCMGRVEEADVMARRLLNLVKSRESSGHLAHARRLLAETAASRHSLEIDQAETHYQDSLALAEELGMRPLQAHCHRGLGKLYSQTGHIEQARTELTTAIEMYRDMEMTFWLPETEATLAAVEGR
jgi:tetratricopeptide (TPR) repeat protein